MLNGRSWRGALVNKRKNGELYEEFTTISPIHDSSGELMAYVAVKHDLTAERRLEADLIRRHLDQSAVGSLMRDVEPLETVEETAAALCRAMRDIDGIDGALRGAAPSGRPVDSDRGGAGVAFYRRRRSRPTWDVTSAAITERTARGSWWMDLRNLEPSLEQWANGTGARGRLYRTLASPHPIRRERWSRIS